MTKRLNLAVLLDNGVTCFWEYRILEELVDSGCADISLFVNKNQKHAGTRHNHYSGLYLFHEKLDKFIFKKNIDFDKKINVLERIKGSPAIKIIYCNGDHSDTIKAGQGNIQKYRPDIILNFGNAPIKSELLAACRYGVLTYSIGNYRNPDMTPSCYWEVVNNMPEIEAVIHLAHKTGDIKSAIFRTAILPYPNSIVVNRSNACDLASLFIPRLIKEINKNGVAYIEELINNFNNNGSSVSLGLTAPTPLQAITNLISLFLNFLVRKLWYHKIGYWFLIVKLKDKNELFPTDPGSFIRLKAPRRKFWADPFVISRDHYHYIFVEEFVYRTGKGHISVLKLDGQGNLLSSETIIEKPYHMSYPHIFEHDESYYMVPESGAHKTIELYKCIVFPNKWVFVRNIMQNIPAKDSTLFFYDHKWWLFTTVIERINGTMSFNELFLYFSDDLFSSDWQSHPKNPIVSDHKRSRPAGKIFIYANKLYRPSQDCSGMYGKALNINCITKLSATEYDEILIKKLEPTWDEKLRGTHTYNFNDKIIVMDVFTDRRRINNND